MDEVSYTTAINACGMAGAWKDGGFHGFRALDRV